jgi:hypothetical protein
MHRILLLILAVLSTWNSAQAQGCGSVRRFDFGNANINIAAKDDGGHSGSAVFHLHDGEAFLSDDPDSVQSHDWEVKLVLDRVVHLDSSDWIRVIVFDKNHLTGTGDWRYIMAFGCKDNSLVRLFQYGSEGVTLKHLDPQELRLYQAVWAPDDARFCPTRHAEILYKWNPRERRFDRANSTVRQGFDFVADEK